jgi:hypothetical protein
MFKWQPRAKCRTKSQHTAYKLEGFHNSDVKGFDLANSKFQERLAQQHTIKSDKNRN